MGVKRLLKDADLLFAQHEIVKKMTGTVTEAEALKILKCSSTTFHRWCKRLRIRRFISALYPIYAKKDIELIRLHRQFGTLIKKLRKL